MFLVTCIQNNPHASTRRKLIEFESLIGRSLMCFRRRGAMLIVHTHWPNILKYLIWWAATCWLRICQLRKIFGFILRQVCRISYFSSKYHKRFGDCTLCSTSQDFTFENRFSQSIIWLPLRETVVDTCEIVCYGIFDTGSTTSEVSCVPSLSWEYWRYISKPLPCNCKVFMKLRN